MASNHNDSIQRSNLGQILLCNNIFICKLVVFSMLVLTTPQKSATDDPFYYGNWGCQHNPLSRHIDHKRVQQVPFYQCLQETYTHWPVPRVWFTPLSICRRGIVKCPCDRSKQLITKSTMISREIRLCTSCIFSPCFKRLSVFSCEKGY